MINIEVTGVVLEVRKNRLRYAVFAVVSLLFGVVLSVALNLYHSGGGKD
jgi:hypothetical protein